MPTTAELTEKYIMGHPSIKDALVKGILNYSSLARLLSKELNIQKKTSKEAILMAIIRLKEKLKQDTIHETKILDLIRNSELEFKNKICTIAAEKTALKKVIALEQEIRSKNDIIYIIEGTTTTTIIASNKHLGKLKKILKNDIIKTTEDLVLVTIKTNKDIEHVKGVMATLCTALYEHDVNIVDTMSSWTDTMFVIEEKDLQLLMQAFKF